MPLFLLLGITGYWADRRYKRCGGAHPTKRDRKYLWSAIWVTAYLLMVLGWFGIPAFELGGLASNIGSFIFALWEFSRWRVRRKLPVNTGRLSASPDSCPAIPHVDAG
jgi:hypothetical protein